MPVSMAWGGQRSRPTVWVGPAGVDAGEHTLPQPVTWDHNMSWKRRDTPIMAPFVGGVRAPLEERSLVLGDLPPPRGPSAHLKSEKSMGIVGARNALEGGEVPPPPLPGAQPMPSHCPPNAKRELQWRL